ncbi:MAG: arylsulfatase [Sedimentisphaerales bacterium]|nr:arylsulfatase [Sedimentisphaerales bacterium]
MIQKIKRRCFLQSLVAGAAAFSLPVRLRAAMSRNNDSRPNIIFIMADDLGYENLGCYGANKIQTPNIDRIAGEGIRFTNCYSGSTICAPSRSVLMTGQHTGHTRVRGNMCTVGGTLGYKGNRQVRRACLTDEDITTGHVLQKAGYKTCLVGKWHLGAYDPKAGPMDRGFDEFYGWTINEAATEGYYPSKRFRNRQLYDVKENQSGQQGRYSTDICTDEAVDFVKNNKDKSFFLYLSYNNPHSPFLVPDEGPYKDKDWSGPCKIFAGMIHRLDQCIGRFMQTLKEQQIDEKTIVFFCSDNGPRSEPTQEQTQVAEFFDSNGPLRGYKRDLYEGGIRVPMMVRWPGKISAGITSDFPWYFADVLPTAAEFAGITPHDNIDGKSIVPVLLGKQKDLGDRFLYWECFENGFQQAVRWKNWKAVRLKKGEPLVLFDLSKDLSEEHDIASENHEIIAQIEEYLKTARTESLNWPL